MDGRYTLRHRKVEGHAELAVVGSTFRLRVPLADPVTRVLDSNAGALAAMNLELTRLTRSGWALADVATGDDEVAAAPRGVEEAGGDDDAVATSLAREGSRVTVDAGESVVTRAQAIAALGPELAREPCDELVLTEGQVHEPPWYQSVEPWCLALASIGSTTLRRFVVDTYSQPLTRQASVFCGDVTGILRVCPALQFVHVIGCAKIRALAHDHLEDLTLMGEPLEPGTIRAVLRGRCPRLARLALGLGYEQPPASRADRALVTAFGESELPALTELHVAYPKDGATVLDAIVSAPAFANLRVLSIQGNVFEKGNRGQKVLERHREALSRLERLHLPLEDLASGTDEELLARIPSLRTVDDAKAFDPSRYRDVPLR